LKSDGLPNIISVIMVERSREDLFGLPGHAQAERR
jgi:hypothetical protein